MAKIPNGVENAKFYPSAENFTDIVPDEPLRCRS